MSKFNEDEIALIEALVRSPVWPILTKMVENYRQECLSALAGASDMNTVCRHQGRIIGASILENLPKILIQQARTRAENLKEKERMAHPHSKKVDAK